MGLLDDAIREHLDLKRRRGADPTEIERAEREALGPVRRGPEVSSEEIAPAKPAAEQQAEAAPAPGEEWEPFHEDPELEALEDDDELSPHEPARGPAGDLLMDHDPLTDHEPLVDDPGAAPPPHAADTASAAEPEPKLAPHPADPPSPPAAPRHDEIPPHLDQETEEYELEEGGEHEGDDDVLETTPEFLQDAPEHDRLWFEQRPPRDFDFDG